MNNYVFLVQTILLQGKGGERKKGENKNKTFKPIDILLN